MSDHYKATTFINFRSYLSLIRNRGQITIVYNISENCVLTLVL